MSSTLNNNRNNTYSGMSSNISYDLQRPSSPVFSTTIRFNGIEQNSIKLADFTMLKFAIMNNTNTLSLLSNAIDKLCNNTAKNHPKNFAEIDNYAKAVKAMLNKWALDLENGVDISVKGDSSAKNGLMALRKIIKFYSSKDIKDTDVFSDYAVAKNLCEQQKLGILSLLKFLAEANVFDKTLLVNLGQRNFTNINSSNILHSKVNTMQTDIANKLSKNQPNNIIILYSSNDVNLDKAADIEINGLKYVAKSVISASIANINRGYQSTLYALDPINKPVNVEVEYESDKQGIKKLNEYKKVAMLGDEIKDDIFIVQYELVKENNLKNVFKDRFDNYSPNIINDLGSLDNRPKTADSITYRNLSTGANKNISTAHQNSIKGAVGNKAANPSSINIQDFNALNKQNNTLKTALAGQVSSPAPIGMRDIENLNEPKTLKSVMGDKIVSPTSASNLILFDQDNPVDPKVQNNMHNLTRSNLDSPFHAKNSRSENIDTIDDYEDDFEEATDEDNEDLELMSLINNINAGHAKARTYSDESDNLKLELEQVRQALSVLNQSVSNISDQLNKPK